MRKKTTLEQASVEAAPTKLYTEVHLKTGEILTGYTSPGLVPFGNDYTGLAYDMLCVGTEDGYIVIPVREIQFLVQRRP